jgi:formylmethanofuran dehydrogenase subunit E
VQEFLSRMLWFRVLYNRHLEIFQITFWYHKDLVDTDSISKYLSVDIETLTTTSISIICPVCGMFQTVTANQESGKSICIGCNMDIGDSHLISF